MRRETMYDVTRKQAGTAMPWAGIVVKVEGGYIGFEGSDDYETWRNQK